MTAFQKPANRAKTKPLQVKFKRLSLNIKTYPPVTNSMPIATRFAFISLFGFNYTLFSTVFCVTFRASRHSQLLKWKSLFYQVLYLMNNASFFTLDQFVNISASFRTVTINAIIPIDHRILVLMAYSIFSSILFSKASRWPQRYPIDH